MTPMEPIKSVFRDVTFSIRRASGTVETLDQAVSVSESDDEQAIDALTNSQEGDNENGISG